ncbi:AAA family ATPase [Methanothermococcus sp. SCGC AD-155-C09]|nr:AAA family ATPase [Methanothermococcus sp. SCGC AD-155-C09]
MIIKGITIKNFKSHKYTELSFNKGITTIIGHNGSGKSSIFEAMSFALYGKGDGKIKDLIKKESGMFSIKLSFELRGNNYEVFRSRGGTTIDRIEINGKPCDGAVSSKEVNNVIKEILGVNHNVFLNAIYIKQGEIDNLINIRPSERKKLIGELLGINKYEKVWERMGSSIGEFKNRLENIKGQLSRMDTIKEDIEKLKEDIVNKELELKELKEEYHYKDSIYKNKKSVLEEYNKKERIYNGLNEGIRDITKDISNIEDRIKDLNRDLETIKCSIRRLRNNEEYYKKYCSIENELKNISKDMEEYRKYYDNYTRLVAIRERLEREIEKINREIKDRGIESIDMEHIENKIKNTNKKLKNLEKLLEKLSKLEDLKSRLEEINRYKKELEENRKHYHEYIKIGEELEILSNKYVEFKNMEERKRNIINIINRLKREILNLEGELISINEIEERIKREEELNKKYIKYRNGLLNLNRTISEKETKIGELEETIQKLIKVDNKCPLCQSDISDSKKEDLLNTYKNNIKRERKELNKLCRELKKHEKEINILEKEINEIRDLKNKYERLREKKRNLEAKYRELNEYNKELQSIEEEIKKYSEIEHKIDKLKKEKGELQEKYEKYIACESYLKGIDEEDLLKRKEALLKVVGDYSREIINQEKEELERELERWKDIRMLILNKMEREEELKNTSNSIESIMEHAKYYKELEKKKSSLEKEKENYKNAYNEYREVLAVLENYSKNYNINIENLENKLKDIIRDKNNEISLLKNKREKYLEELNTLNYSREYHEDIMKEVEERYNELNSIDKETNKHNAHLKYLKENLENLNKELRELKEKKREKEKLDNYIKYLEDIREKVFSKNGFQQYLREKYIPIIQKYTNEIFSEFELPYYHIQIKEDYDILVDDLPVKSLSGGEQVAVSLALRLGIAKAVCNDLQCIILDEPTAFLDEDRRKKLLNIFRNIKTISQIFIISHHQELEQVADNIISVKKVGEDSKVSIYQG